MFSRVAKRDKRSAKAMPLIRIEPRASFLVSESALPAGHYGQEAVGQLYSELLKSRALLADAAHSAWGRCPITTVALKFGLA